MADIKLPRERSRNMAAIHGRDTKPEVHLRKLLFAQGYRYRKNYAKIPGHPDIYLPRYRTAIFVHGCFWHRHAGCKYAYMPKSNVEFWKEKFQNNINRDQKVKRKILASGNRYLVVWECFIKKAIVNEDKKEKLSNLMEVFLKRLETYLEMEDN